MNFFLSIFVAIFYILKSIVLLFVPKHLRFKSLTNEVVLITGGGSGIGRALAILMAKAGVQKIVILDLNEKGMNETRVLIENLGVNCYTYTCDVSNRKQVYACGDKIKKDVGDVTILVNNAGIVSGKSLLEIPDDKIIKTMEVNTLAHFWTCKTFLPDMMEKNHGHIVSIASLAGINGMVNCTDYCASKFAAVGFEEALRYELKATGFNRIHSTVVCPYFINTGMFDGINPGYMPLLNTDDVARNIMDAILTNQEILFIPKIFYFLDFLKSFVPTKATWTVLEGLNIIYAMDTFKGRQKTN